MAATNDAPGAEATEAICSFCGKSQGDVRKMVSGPKNIFICDECVVLCLQIVSRDGLNVRIAYFSFEFVAKLLYPVARLFHQRNT